MKAVVLSLVLATLPNSVASQPYSQSMAECAGLLDSLGALTTDDGLRADVGHIAENWAQAARDRSTTEGQDDPAQYVTRYREAKAQEWAAKGLLIIFSQDFRDWTSYCRSFAEHLNLDIYPV